MSNQLVIAASWDLVKTRARLFASAEMTETEFHSGVMAYLDARKGSSGSSSKGGSKRGAVLKFGKAKGKTMGEADTDDLQWMLKVSLEGLENPDKQNFRESNETLISGLVSELTRRGVAVTGNIPKGVIKTPSGSVIRFGKSKGLTMGEAATDDLKWMLKVSLESLENPDKQNFRKSNEDLIVELEAELVKRGATPTEEDVAF